MKFKKIEKNILICSLSVVGLGAVVGTALAITNEVKSNSKSLLSNENIQNEESKIFSGAVLTKAEVQKIGWDTKTTITLDDWKRDAPNVTDLGDASTVSGSGNEAPFSSNRNLRSIEIPKTVTKINYAAFFETPSLETVTFETGTALSQINGYVFRKSNIKNIVIPNTVTVIGEAAFDESKITTINIPRGVTTLGKWAFRSTSSLQNITFEANSTLESIGQETFRSSGITSINIPNSVTNIANDSFTNTTGLMGASISISSRLRKGSLNPIYGFNETQWNSISWRIEKFEGTTLLKADVINLNWHTKQDITLQDWTAWAPNVTQISTFASSGEGLTAAFIDNKILRSIQIPAKVTEINFGSFTGTSSLQTVTFENNSSLRVIGVVAFRNSSIRSIEIPEKVISLEAKAFEAAQLTSVTFKKGSLLTNIKTQAFIGTRIQRIDIPPKVTTIGSFVFWATLLTQVNVPDSVTSIGQDAFSMTPRLQGSQVSMSITLRKNSNRPLYGFTQAQWVAIAWRTVKFEGTTLLKADVEKLGWNLRTEITLDDWKREAPNVTRISETATSGSGPTAAFSGNTTLRTIAIPNKITQINFGSFFNTKALQTVTFENNSKLTLIGPAAFRQSTLSSIRIPSSVTELGNASFEETLSLKSLTFDPSSKLATMGDLVFRGTSISSITLPDSVESIGNNAFQDTNSLPGANVSMQIKLRQNSSTSLYGFTQDQWDAIAWRGAVTLTDEITSFRINFTEGNNIVSLPPLTPSASSSISAEAREVGLTLEYAMGATATNLITSWGTAENFKTAIQTYSNTNNILKSQLNIFARMYIPSATGPSNNMIGNVTYTWNRSPIKIYDNQTGIIPNVFVVPNTTNTLSNKFIRAYARVDNNWAQSLSAGGNKSTEVKISSFDGSFDVTAYSNLGIQLEVNPTASNTDNWTAITALGAQTFNASVTNKMKFRLSVVNSQFYEMIGTVVETSTTPSGIRTQVIEKDIVAKIELTGINSADLISNKLSVTGTTHNLVINENNSLYTASGLDLATAKTFFEIKYSHDGRTYFNATNFIAHLTSMRGTALNDLNLANFKVRYEFTREGSLRYFSTQVANDVDAATNSTRTLVTTSVKKTIDITSQIADIPKIQISGTTQEITWSRNESILALNTLVKVEYGSYVRKTDETIAYEWSETIPTSLYVTTPPEGQSNFPLAIRFVPKAEEVASVVIGSIDTGGLFIPTNSSVGYEVDVNKLLSIINVNTTRLNAVLLLTGFANNLNGGAATEQIERPALELVDNSFRSQVELKYQISILPDVWFSLIELQSYLKNYLTNYTNSTSGIIIFRNGTIPGVTIKAKFVAKDPTKFTVISSPNEEVTLNTDQIKTSVDLKGYVKLLETQKVIPTGTSHNNLGTLTMPKMSGGNVPFSGKTFDQIQEIIGGSIDIQFKAPGHNGDAWVALNEITAVNVDNDLYVRFVVKGAATNIELSLVGTNDWEEHQTNGFKLSLSLPLEIQVNSANLVNLISLSGNTKNLTINDAKVYEALIAANSEYEGKVKILYTIGKVPMHLDPNNKDKIEFTKSELENLLRLNTIDVTLDEKQITARYALADGINPNDFVIKDTKTVNLNVTNILLYINKSNYYELAEKLKVSGTSSEIMWGPEIDELIRVLSKGLQIQYSIDPTANATDSNDDSKWTITQPTSISPTTKFLVVRMIVLNGYIFEESPKLFRVNTDNVLLVIALQSNLLDSILLTGNTRNIVIDSTKFKEALETQNIPGREFIEIQYYFGGTPPTNLDIPVGTEWFNETQIKEILSALRGAKNTRELILFRDSLRARYLLNDKGYETYRMNIDGTFIEGKFPDQPALWRRLVTPSVNVNFNGYINLDLINTFVPDSFQIVGSDKQPQLNVANSISEMLDYYKDQTTVPFDIYYSKTQGDFNNKTYKLFGSSGFISRFDDTFTIDLDTNGNPIPIFFKIVARPGYKIFENNTELADGKVIQITNFDIQPQITNPLSVPPIIRFKSSTNELFYQGEGSLSVYDTTTNNLVDSVFLNKEYPNVTPAVLKLQYNVSDKEYTPEELAAVIADANAWSDNVPTNLKVGQYVMVRVAVNNPLFTMLGGDAMTGQIRVSGLRVHADRLSLSPELILTNTDIYGYAALDGQTKIEMATIVPDNLGNYLGADLQMSVDSEFYRDTTGKIILDLNNIPIIKRNSEGATVDGNYLDQAGNPILDADGNPIPILVIQKGATKIPAPPLSTGVWKDPMNMIDSSVIGSFSQNDNGLLDWRLFEGQKVRFSFIARVGQGTTTDPDFIFDTTTAPTPEITLTNVKYIIPTHGINYRFDQDQLKSIAYASDDNSEIPYTGSSHISSLLSVVRISASFEEQTLVGTDIESQVSRDFDDRVEIRMQLVKQNGTTVSAIGSDLKQFNGLQNGDVLTISFESKDPNYLLPKPISPLTIIIKGLFVRPLDTNLFRNLRPNFTGVLNGSGTFSIKVTDPNNPAETNEAVLGPDQWYEYQVWNTDKSLKTAWTRDETRINNLVNGDKIEWKIVNRDGVFENDYYNTLLANNNGSNEIKFKVVNVIDKIEHTVQEGIGSSGKLNPDQSDGKPNYPENSGWVVSGLKIEITLDSIQQEKIEQALASFQPTFSGVDKFGTMDSNIMNDNSISPDVVIVWYTSGPDGVARRITNFKEANLSNGDKVWATIAPSQSAIENNLVIDESISQMQSKVFIVEGLTTIVNSTTQTLVISMITASSVLLVGAIATVVFIKKKGKLSGNKKF